MGQYQARSKSIDEEQAPGTVDQGVTSRDGGPLPVFGSPIDSDSFLGTSVSPAVTPTKKIPPAIEEQPSSLLTRQKDGLELEKKKRTIPIVFRWDGGGNEVYVCGTFNNWETKIPMTNSQGDFTAIVDLPEGEHEYKFYVDGEWLHNPDEPASNNGLGSYNNIVTVSKKHFDAYFETWDLLADKGDSSPPGSYSQQVPPRSATSGLPPHLPPLLQQTVLNQDLPDFEDPTLLPQPNHVILNHLYALSIKDNVLVLAATHRYKEKYVTTLLYKPVTL